MSEHKTVDDGSRQHDSTTSASHQVQVPILDRAASPLNSTTLQSSLQPYPNVSRSEKTTSSPSLVDLTLRKKQRSNPHAGKYEGEEAGSRRSIKIRKWILIGVGLVIIVGLVIGIVVWKVTAKKSNGSGKLEYIEGTSKTVKSDPKNPSKFEKDPRLKPLFYGITYTPLNVQEPDCGATLANVTEDIQLLSQLTTRIRTYDSSCNQSELILQAIHDTKINLTVWLGASLGDNNTVNLQQQDYIIAALDKYGTDHVGGVTIGNKFAVDADSTAGRASLIIYIAEHLSDFRTRLSTKNYHKTLPVGSADDFSSFNVQYGEAVDFIMANMNTFPLITPSHTGGWTWDRLEYEYASLQAYNETNLGVYLTEVGWPTDSMDNVNRTVNGAVAGISGLQTSLDSFPCQANLNGTRYFWTEAFDQSWKEQIGGVEPFWGLFDSNRKLKNITLPDCEINSRQASG